MGCPKLIYYENKTPLKVMYGGKFPVSKNTQCCLSVDPLASKFPSYSPYVFCLDNPINLTDPDGREPKGTSPPWWREFVFFASHPNIAPQIGEFVKGSTNISTDAVRFSTRGNVLNENKNKGEE